MQKNFFIFLGCLLAGLVPALTLAMSSASYQINADSINSGGNLSTSASFRTFDSIGETFIGSMSSTNFTIGEGLAPMTTFSIVLTLDSNVKNLGAVTAGTPITGNTTASVTTDAWGGYDLYVKEDNNLKHTDGATTIGSFACSIASPCVWSGTGLGFTVNSGTSVEAKWGTNPNYNYAAIPTSSAIFHTKAGYKSGVDNTVVGYKLDVPTSQKSGDYSNVLTYTAISKL